MAPPKYFTVSSELFKLFPELKVGVVVVQGTLSPKEDTFRFLKEVCSSITIHEKPQELPQIKVWREAFKKVGITPSKYLSSVEALVRRVQKGQVPGPIHPLVDLYNAFSIKNLVPVGGHDLDKISGFVEVGFSKGGEEFIDFSGNVERVPEGEVVYRDELGILTRRWVWRQTKRDIITPETTRVFIPIDVLHTELSAKDLVGEMEELIKRFFSGISVKSGIVDRERNTFDF